MRDLLARGLLGALKLAPRGFFLFAVRGGLAQRARLLVRELLDLAADFGAQRATAALERLELARVARDLALEPRSRLRREVPQRASALLTTSGGALPDG